MTSQHLVSGGIDLTPSARARVDELAELLTHHRAKYYAGMPEISDAAFDGLEDELRALDPTNAVLAHVGAPVAAATEWEKARHELPMGSLNKVVTAQELRAWFARCREIGEKEGLGVIDEKLFVAEKLDGISIEIIYRDGRLTDAITRGDGLVGERITANVARMKGVPSRIAHPQVLSVRGEIILRLSDMRANFPGMVSSRNAAAGTAKRFDGVGVEHLTVLFYDAADHVALTSETRKFSFLRELGFATPRFATGSLDDVERLYTRYGAELRDALDYEIDGLVVSLDSRHDQALLGELNGRPRGAVAFKFASPAKVTRVLEILWDTGASGRVTPVAVVEPVELASAVVQRASLHNASRVRALGIAVGDDVLVSRRNDVIPYVEEVVVHRRSPAEPPTHCPVCGEPLATVGEYLLCRNLECSAIVEGRIHSWIDAIGALEWGDKLVEQVVAAKLVKEPADLYALTVEDLAKLERRGEKIAKKCLRELRAPLPLTLPVFLAALGIEGFALQTARLLVSAGLTTLNQVLAAEESELSAIAGLGPIKAANIVRGLAARRAEIDRLAAVGIVPTSPEQAGPLSGMTFAFTGASSRPRVELARFVEAHGGRVLTSVTKELTHLVIADLTSTSTKAVKARKLGTKLIDEQELMELASRV
jgi:DNA ligase (NAD+)